MTLLNSELINRLRSSPDSEPGQVSSLAELKKNWQVGATAAFEQGGVVDRLHLVVVNDGADPELHSFKHAEQLIDFVKSLGSAECVIMAFQGNLIRFSPPTDDGNRALVFPGGAYQWVRDENAGDLQSTEDLQSSAYLGELRNLSLGTVKPLLPAISNNSEDLDDDGWLDAEIENDD